VRHVDMPFKRERIWKLIQQGTTQQGSRRAK